MASLIELEVELFGVPRLLAGRSSLLAVGETLADVTRSLGAGCPSLIGPVIDSETGWLLPGYTFVVEERFTRKPEFRLDPTMAVLLVSSVAGG